MNPQPDIHAFLPLTHLSLHILLAVCEGELHGYAIVKSVEELSAGKLTPGTGTFYSALHRLQKDGLLAEADPPADAERQGPRRRYYRSTALGAQVLKAETKRLQRLLRKARAMRPEVAG